MSEDPISQLAALIARQQVIDTIDLLFAATDAKDWATVRGVLAPAVRFDMSSAGGPPASMRTGEAIAADWERGLAPIQAIHHQAGNYRVGLTDIDRAGAFCYGIAYHYLPKASGRNTRVFVGSYDFELARTGETWRITAFKYNLKFIDGNLELEKPD
jgi:SnoaL-like protein